MHLLAPTLLFIYMRAAGVVAKAEELALPVVTIMVVVVVVAGDICKYLLLRFRVQHSLQEPPLILM
jgi:membrane protein DedA with SNARE-associated domain